MDYALPEELIAISSIFGPDIITLEQQTAPSSAPLSPTQSSCILHVPHTAIQLRLLFPPTYPSGPSAPTVDSVVSVGPSSSRHGWGQLVLDGVRGDVERAWVPGEPVLLALIEVLMEREGRFGGEGGADGAEEAIKEGQGAVEVGAGEGLAGSRWAGPEEWFVSAPVVEKKSTFIAHAAAVANPTEARAFTESLLASDRKFEKATHNIRAFRGRFTPEGSGRELVFQDCDDDGEDAAGGRLLHLLELTDSDNVLVVVSRWYGGIKLGPDRFRIINQVARDALVAGGFVKEDGKKAAKRAR